MTDPNASVDADVMLVDTAHRRLEISGSHDRLTHYLLRYPAKFHPPVVRALLEEFTKPGGTVYDPFCGSGTLLVEAAVTGRNAIGSDIDPVAVATAKAKVMHFDAAVATAAGKSLLEILAAIERPATDYVRFQFEDLDDVVFAEQLQVLEGWVPAIPNLEHWFRRYVVIDLARMRRAIDANIDADLRPFFDVVFASVLRNASNADPVPVSGLEVTSHMKQRDALGRIVNPFELFRKALLKALQAAAGFSEAAKDVTLDAYLDDATELAGLAAKPSAVITSPPYHNAVDYYRRHQLEMFWLGHTPTQEDRLALLPKYLGRPRVQKKHPFVAEALETPLAASWEQKIRAVSDQRADDFRHYLVGMRKFFEALAPKVRAGTPLLMVVGHSDWNGEKLPTTQLFDEISGDAYRLNEVLWYPVTNRYMSYKRRNGADISKEYVVVLRRAPKRRR